MFTKVFDQRSLDHKEAVRLARPGRLVSVVTILITGWITLIGVLSTISSILAVSPTNGIPG